MEALETHNTTCTSEQHGQHLCYLIAQGIYLSEREDFEALVREPRYRCNHCDRIANHPRNLCEPVDL